MALGCPVWTLPAERGCHRTLQHKPLCCFLPPFVCAQCRLILGRAWRSGRAPHAVPCLLLYAFRAAAPERSVCRGASLSLLNEQDLCVPHVILAAPLSSALAILLLTSVGYIVYYIPLRVLVHLPILGYRTCPTLS